MKPRLLQLLIRMIFILLVCALPGSSVGAVVDLLYFSAIPGSVSIMLNWETATEFDNIGFYVQRGLTLSGPFNRISTLVLSYGDPLTGHIYSYEDVNVGIGIQYYYVLEIINANNTSGFTAPVAAIIPAPTATPTITRTTTPTPTVAATLTITITPNSQPPATKTPTMILSTQTVTFTPSPTATSSQTPTTTLEPISISNLGFPALSPTAEKLTETVEPLRSPTVVSIVRETDSIAARNLSPLLIFAIIFLWIVLALFLILCVRIIKPDGTRK